MADQLAAARLYRGKGSPNALDAQRHCLAKTCLLVIGLIATCLTFATMATAGECEKAVRWRHDPPYFWQAPDGRITGMHADLVRATLESIGCTAQFQEMPWARALLELEEGRLDILSGALKTPERERYAYFSRPINRSPNVLFVSQAARMKYLPKTLTELIGTGFRLGAQHKVSYGPEYDSLLANPNFTAQLTLVTDRRSAWKMIQADRLDGLIADQITGLIELNELGLSGAIVATPLVVSEATSHIALSRRSIDQVFFRRFDQALDKLFRDGTASGIIQHYLPCKVAADGLGCR